MGQHKIVTITAVHRRIQPGLFASAGGGIMREAQHHQAQSVPLSQRERIEIGSPLPLSTQRQGLNGSIRQFEAAPMGGVRGVEDQRRIPWIEHGKRQMGRPLLGANQQQHLTVSINRHTKALLAPGRRGLPKRFRTSMQAVGRTGRFRQDGGHGPHGRRRRQQIG